MGETLEICIGWEMEFSFGLDVGSHRVKLDCFNIFEDAESFINPSQLIK
jgi:hypothetical protein